ncbi:hypothetical protein HMF8227_02051 [Saliniradius amylolyticus]|uniref:Aminoglycoside phosphotransferase domain-containing protein n=1 Tax=Saliniradius amylolyticus TaxID=2183582 RepID=A0A2S2E4D5_9ALTE|nr:phosphotransferase [Saliniradius amylolyticus]AWL12515.1 hypothetical protein HMF8227_02051 [Saliniradius amylolyticus]
MRPEPNVIEELVEQGLCNRDADWKKLDEGAINDNFVLKDNDTELFLKCFAQKTPARIDRQVQYQIQQQLAKQGFAPEPLYLGVQSNFMLEPWLDLTPIAKSRTPRELKVAFLAKRLAQIHALDIEAPELDLIGDWQHYLDSGAMLSEGQQKMMQEYEQLWRSVDKSCFCHHDLAFSHVCVSPQNMTLDWEYAALSNPAFDIASCVWINELSRAEMRTLVKVYAAESSKNWRPLEELTSQFLPLANFTAELWLQVAGLSRQEVVAE